jgi:hypothetical protein
MPSISPNDSLCVYDTCVQDAKEVVIIITGVSKAVALQQVVEGAMSHQWTASAIQMHPNGVIVVDEDATNELKVRHLTLPLLNQLAAVVSLPLPSGPTQLQVKTVKYWRGVEQTESL